MIELAVATGIVFSLFFIEAFGIAAGGIIVPGFIALQLGKPDRLIGTILIAFITFLLLRLIGRFTFLYGRRQMVIAILIGTIFAIVSHKLLYFSTTQNTFELSAVGWVVPGLIANWSAKQGFIKTLAMLAIISVLVRLIVIIVFNGSPIPDLY